MMTLLLLTMLLVSIGDRDAGTELYAGRPSLATLKSELRACSSLPKNEQFQCTLLADRRIRDEIQRQAQEEAERQLARQAAEEKAEEDAAQAAKRVREEPEKMRTGISAALCMVSASEALALKEIGQEREDSKIAGVVSVSKLRRLQDEVLKQRALRQHLLVLLDGKKALKCGTKIIQSVLSCTAAYEGSGSGVDELPAECASSDANAMAHLPLLLIEEAEAD